jgi:hypothetical protein
MPHLTMTRQVDPPVDRIPAERGTKSTPRWPRKRHALLVALALGLAMLIPNLSASASDPTQLASTIREVAQSDPSRLVWS